MSLVASLCLYSQLVKEATPAFSESLVLETGFRNPLRGQILRAEALG